MDKHELIKKITGKKEFSELPQIDVEIALEHFASEKFVDEEKIKLTRDLLRRVFSAFSRNKLLNPKILEKKSSEEILKKHFSTTERVPYFSELYSRILRGENKKINVIDLGAGVNGFSYNFFKEAGFEVYYVAVESIGQLVSLMNCFFKKEKLNACAVHESLFNLEKIKKEIEKCKTPRIIFLFKVLDSLEMMKRDYSKKLLEEIAPLADRIVVSFATRSLVKKTKFKVRRYWFENFAKEKFNILDDFEIGGEKYFVLGKR